VVLSFVALMFGTSLFFCRYIIILKVEWMLRQCELTFMSLKFGCPKPPLSFVVMLMPFKIMNQGPSYLLCVYVVTLEIK